MELRTFHKFQRLVYDRAGIALNDGKESLVSARLAKRMRTLNIENPESYFKYLVDHESEGELVTFLDAISTNFTSFFRENDHFEFLEKIMTDWIQKDQKRFRIWCAASSTGEEPYSLGVTLLKLAEGHTLDIKILATDISTRVLSVAKEGIYPEKRIQMMPPMLRERYFDRSRNQGERCYCAKPELKNLITYKRLNLSTPPFPMHGPLDVIFCRNVMIYFDNTVRRKLIKEAHRLLRPNGYLIVGHSESLTGLVENFKGLGPSVYQKIN